MNTQYTPKITTKFKMARQQKRDLAMQKIPMKFDVTMLNMFIGYLFKQSKNINRKSLTNMRQLFSVIDENVYEGNDALEARFEFIQKALKAKLDLGMENESIIVDYCRSDTGNEANSEIIKNLDRYKKINYEEIIHINKAITDRLHYGFILAFSNHFEETLTKLNSGDFDNYSQIVKELTDTCSALISQTRKTSSVEDTETFSLDVETFEETVTDIVEKLKDPSRIFITGIRAWNEILSPGYLSKRLYIYMGLPAGFKSGILLKTAVDIRKYNKEAPTKKPGYRKTLLFVTMENTVDETVERLFNMTVTIDDIRKYTPKQVIKMLKKDGEMVLEDDNDIDIVIKYYPNRSIDTNDLYTIIADMEDERREVITLILDYIKRIRPAEYAKDEKEELKNITNELKTLAIELDIPVITAHQLNRNAAGTIDAAMESNKEDLGRFVGRSNVGSAWEVMENADWACIVNVEKKRDTGQYYLTFKRIKIRYRELTDLGYFNHPFVMGNRIQLIDDLHMESSISEASLTSDFDAVDLGAKKGKQTAKERVVVDDDSTDVFDFASSIGSKKKVG